MTKMIKLSLAAATVVAGLTTTASAADTAFSGKVYVEQNAKTTTASTITTSDIDIDVTGKMKISDTLTAVATIQADSTEYSNQAAASSKAATVEKVYISYSKDGLTAQMGRLPISTPSTDGNRGNGVLASYNMGSMTFTAAQFMNNSDIPSAADASAFALTGTAGPVNFQAWTVALAGHSTNNTFVIGAKAGAFNVAARYATTNYNASTPNGKTTKLSASTKLGTVALSLDYLMTGKNGAAYMTDNSSANGIENATFATNAQKDAKAYNLAATIPLVQDLSLTLKYANSDFKTTVADDSSMSEALAQLNYTLAKNTKMTVRYTDFSQDLAGTKTDFTTARLDITYKF